MADSSTIEQPSPSTNTFTLADENTAKHAILRRFLDKPPPAPMVAAAGALGITLVGGLLGAMLRRKGSKKTAVKDAIIKAQPAASSMANPAPVPQPPQAPVGAVDLSPFGSPVGSTPVRIPPLKSREKTHAAVSTASEAAASEADDDNQSDNASVRDQRQTQLVMDATQLQKTLKQMQEMAEENRRMSAFLAEYKADAEKLSKLEEENRALRNVTQQLEQEMQEIKVNAMPRTGAELEAFKSNLNAPPVARSVYSTDDPVGVGLGLSTASVDGTNPDARVRRNNLFKQLLATLQGTSSAGVSQPVTPRSTSGGGNPPPSTKTSQRQRKQPRPEEAAAIGQAVYQLLDQFGGRMM